MPSAVAAAIVDWQALLQVVAVSLVGGVGVTAVFSIALAGATRLADFRRDGRPLAATLAGLLAFVALAVCVAAIVLGLGIMVAK